MVYKISKMKVDSVKDVVDIGQRVWIKVIEVKDDERHPGVKRVGLSMKVCGGCSKKGLSSVVFADATRSHRLPWIHYLLKASGAMPRASALMCASLWREW